MLLRVCKYIIYHWRDWNLTRANRVSLDLLVQGQVRGECAPAEHARHTESKDEEWGAMTSSISHQSSEKTPGCKLTFMATSSRSMSTTWSRDICLIPTLESSTQPLAREGECVTWNQQAWLFPSSFQHSWAKKSANSCCHVLSVWAENFNKTRTETIKCEVFILFEIQLAFITVQEKPKCSEGSV